MPVEYLQTYVMLFGTQLMGGTFNITQMMIFILGLFVTLVINRFFQIRALYAKIHSVTVELVITATTFLQPPLNGTATPQKAQMMRRARAQVREVGRVRVLQWAGDAQSTSCVGARSGRVSHALPPSLYHAHHTHPFSPHPPPSWPATSTSATS